MGYKFPPFGKGGQGGFRATNCPPLPAMPGEGTTKDQNRSFSYLVNDIGYQEIEKIRSYVVETIFALLNACSYELLPWRGVVR